MQRHEIGELAYGREAAAQHGRFVGAYKIVESRLGKQVVGDFPDGRTEFMCTRCYASLKNVYVFANPSDSSFMHVGMDCAEVMGVSPEELTRAQNYWRNAELEARRAANAIKYAAERAERATAEARSMAACAPLVDEIHLLLRNPNLTRFENEALHNALDLCKSDPNWYQPEWVVDFAIDWHRSVNKAPVSNWSKTSALLDAVRERIALCDSSKPVTGKAITGAFRAYRAPMTLESSAFGDSYLSFLTDDTGNAYYTKSNEFMVRQGCTIIGTFSIGEAEQRNGLTATRLLRPRKINTDCYASDSRQWTFGLTQAARFG
jgi:hypothetical protein